MMKQCENESCGKMFKRIAHNAKYCSPECRKIVSDKNILERYHRLKAISRSPERICINCGIKLSIYNKSTLCNVCSYNLNNSGLKDIVEGLSSL